MPTKILAIDDSKTMRLAIKITFAAEDADVTAISKGSEAIARAKQLAPDIILVDAKLADGESSGYDITRALKADPATAHIPVLLMVSNQDGIDQAAVASSGAHGAISKPFDTQELIDEVASALSGASRSAAARPAAAAMPARPAAAVAAAAPSAPARPAAAAAPARAGSGPVAAPAAAAAAPAARPRAANGTGAGGHAEIPVAIPIPFTSASAPTPGMLQRLQAAAAAAGGGGAAPELDPNVAAAIVALSREVIEQVVWEVVPDLAESILRQRASTL